MEKQDASNTEYYKRVAALAEKTGKRMRSAAKAYEHKGATRKRAASMKVKR